MGRGSVCVRRRKCRLALTCPQLLVRSELGFRNKERGMKKGRFSEEQIIGILKRHEAGQKVTDLAREHGISEATIYTWKSKYGGMEVSEAQRLKSLEDENRRLKHLVADLSLDKEVLKAVIAKNGWSSQLNGKL
jgi:putative transposase